MGCTAELAARLRRSARTTAVSQFTKRVCPSAHAPPRALRAPGASRREPRTSIRAIAALGRVSRAQAPRAAQPGPSAAMARVDVRLPNPLLAAPAAGRLGGERGRRSAHASLTDSPWLSEPRAPAQSEFHGAPSNRPGAGLPRSEAQGSQTGGRLSFAYFSLAKQRKVSRPPGRQPGLRPQHKHAFQTSAPRPRQAQPERYGANRVAIKTIAASAFYTSASRQNH
jgi:hypothetical protein